MSFRQVASLVLNNGCGATHQSDRIRVVMNAPFYCLSTIMVRVKGNWIRYEATPNLVGGQMISNKTPKQTGDLTRSEGGP